MNYHSYTVLPEFATKESKLAFRATGNGEYILGTKGGIVYFIKRNIHVRKPLRSAAEALYKLQKADADYLEQKQKALLKRMAALTPETSGIVREHEHFWDEDNFFVTVTPFIEGALPCTFDTARSLSETVELLKGMAQALACLHEVGVVHADLKEANFMLRKTAGRLQPLLIDFDSAFPADSPPPSEKVAYSEGYQNPEAVRCMFGEAEPAELTSAGDVFTLAIVFHRLLTGSFPSVDAEKLAVGEAVACNREVFLSNKLDCVIGKKNRSTLLSLLYWMLLPDWKARPTAKQVLQVLQDALKVPADFRKGSDCSVFTPLWPSHEAFASVSETELQAKGVTSFRRETEGGLLKYRVLYESDERVLTVEQLLTEGLANRLAVSVCSPWPSDAITFAPNEKLAEMGYVSLQQSTANHQYILATVDGLRFSKSKESLIKMGLATPKIVVKPETDTPWPEHGETYADGESLSILKISSIKRLALGDEHAYLVQYADGRESMMKPKAMQILRLIK